MTDPTAGRAARNLATDIAALIRRHRTGRYAALNLPAVTGDTVGLALPQLLAAVTTGVDPQSARLDELATRTDGPTRMRVMAARRKQTHLRTTSPLSICPRPADPDLPGLTAA